jgi:hypothetical protein
LRGAHEYRLLQYFPKNQLICCVNAETVRPVDSYSGDRAPVGKNKSCA